MAGGARRYRADVKNNDSNVVPAVLALRPLTVCISINGLYGEDETWGAGAQLTMTF
ncbi:conjugative transfer protein [Salmonella enterica subsp. enterica]|uniref:Conjugative transfer protein n=1 Tax=Salmonella enterica I TaxID=59201 RepID=A0A379X499_SALET|nr:conjugative transfer protein [Salmonella enterica subsp. enterica]